MSNGETNRLQELETKVKSKTRHSATLCGNHVHSDQESTQTLFDSLIVTVAQANHVIGRLESNVCLLGQRSSLRTQ